MMIKATFLTLVAITAISSSLFAQAATPASSPSLEQRVSDLEAYVNNSARGADAANAQAGSNISGPGPGHNAWLMTSALLVLFMTLPGLALFYGGLVRQKNVLSVLAQCLGIEYRVHCRHDKGDDRLAAIAGSGADHRRLPHSRMLQ